MKVAVALITCCLAVPSAAAQTQSPEWLRVGVYDGEEVHSVHARSIARGSDRQLIWLRIRWHETQTNEDGIDHDISDEQIELDCTARAARTIVVIDRLADGTEVGRYPQTGGGHFWPVAAGSPREDTLNMVCARR